MMKMKLTEKIRCLNILRRQQEHIQADWKTHFSQIKSKTLEKTSKKLELERERLLRGEKPKSRFSNRQQRAAARMLAGFFIMMLALTVLSRMAVGLTVAQVTTSEAKAGVLTQRFNFSGSIETQETLDVLLPGDLRISGWTVREGDRVAVGDKLLSLDPDSVQKKIEQLQDEVTVLNMKISNLANGISTADSSLVARAEAALAQAQEDYDRLINGLEISDGRVEEDLKAAQENYDTALTALETAKTQAKQQLIQAAQEELEAAEKALSDARYNREEAIAAAESALESAEQAYSSAQNSYDSACRSLQEAERQLKSAQDALDALLSQTEPPATPEQLTAAQNAVNTAQSQVNSAQSQVDAAASNLSRDAVDRAKETLKRVKDRQKQLVSEAEDAVYAAEVALSNAEKQTDFSGESLVIAAQSAVDTAYANLKSAQRNYEDSGLSREEKILNAERAIDSAKAELESAKKQTKQAQQSDENAKRQNEIERIQYDNERSEKQSLLDQLTDIQKQEYVITAPVSGTVKMTADMGLTQEDSAVVTLSRADQSFQFVSMVDQKAAEKLAVGDEATLTYTSGGITQTATVYLSSIGTPNQDGEVRITAQLSGSEFSSGLSATLEIKKSSQQYQTILPVSALHSKDGKTVIFVVQEKQTVMGTEQTVEEIEVSVKEQDMENVAVEAVILPDTKVVISASKPIEKGDRIRVED